MRKITIIMMMLMTSIISLQAQNAPSKVQAIRTPIVRELPNGDTLTIYLRGDEHKHWTMTLDGWGIVEKENGYFYYQKAKKGSETLRTSCRKAHEEGKRSKCEKRWLEKHGVKRGA